MTGVCRMNDAPASGRPLALYVQLIRLGPQRHLPKRRMTQNATPIARELGGHKQCRRAAPGGCPGSHRELRRQRGGTPCGSAAPELQSLPPAAASTCCMLHVVRSHAATTCCMLHVAAAASTCCMLHVACCTIACCNVLHAVVWRARCLLSCEGLPMLSPCSAYCIACCLSYCRRMLYVAWCIRSFTLQVACCSAQPAHGRTLVHGQSVSHTAHFARSCRLPCRRCIRSAHASPPATRPLSAACHA
jgi:hypothetical protein